MESDMDFDCVDSDEREMGTESEYEGVLDTKCDECGNEISLKINIWEYPVGAFNDWEHEEDGATILEEPTVTFLEDE